MSASKRAIRKTNHNTQYLHQIDRFLRPDKFAQTDFNEVYKKNKVVMGTKENEGTHLNGTSRLNSVCIVGAQFGDEGKGRLVDNTIQQLLSTPGVKNVYVVRYQGGSNAGHTVYTKKGIKIPLHQIPSSVLESKAIGIMDRGMAVNMEDLKIEIVDAEKILGDLRGRIMLSDEALLNTDLERAKEVLNRVRSGGNSKGGTTRGIAPTYADHYTRLGLFVKDLFVPDWKNVFAKRYDRYRREFRANGVELRTIDVPDLRATRDTGKPASRKVGTLNQYIERLAKIRQWFVQRDNGVDDKKKMRRNTFTIHTQIYNDMSKALIFEGAQAVGLHPWLGRYPDVTASDTSVDGIASGTGFYRAQDVKQKIGVFKLTYMSSVGDAHMLSAINIPRTAVESTKGMNKDQLYALKVREIAQERGTTTGRYRDICFLDLPLMRYNIKMGGIESLAGTHLDISWESEPIKVCTHYVDKKGNNVVYQPGVVYQQNITPQYMELPGWDGESVRRAKKVSELPINARKYLAFLQRQIGVPILAVTTGPERKHLLMLS